jgi:signal transduction histidine kinase
VTLALDTREPECDADRDLLESAIENVVRNAVEATPDGGSVRVETDAADAWIVVRVIDTGVGMNARQLARAFEDFFTTKPSGSGLGLAFARRVLLAHDGDVGITSESGRGTTVELRLPR